eukprot:11120922-Karenia_brevis.AAC.1
MQASQTAAASSIGKLQEAVADEVNGSGTIDPDYNRAPNFGILRIGTAQKANRGDIEATLEHDWLGGLFPRDQWTLSGPDSGINWVLSFTAVSSRATRQVSKARGALRLGGGQWQDIYSKDCQGNRCKVYVNPDASPQVARIQAATKRFHGVVAEMYPLLKVTFTKPAFHPKMEPQGVVAVNGIDIVAIKAPSPFEDVDVFWAPAGESSTQAERLGINKQQVSGGFEEKAAANARPGVDTSM